MTLAELKAQGYASYSELKEGGIKQTIEKGKNEWGFNERTIIDNDGNEWDYIPEDTLYEVRNPA